MNEEIKLVEVTVAELDVLKQYIAALYEQDKDYESLINIEEGVKSLMRNSLLATAYFIKRGEERIGYVILTRYHSVEKGGLTFYIDELFVEAPFRRQGVGRKMMVAINEIAELEGAKGLWVQTQKHNEAAQKFFQSCHFERSTYKNYERNL